MLKVTNYPNPNHPDWAPYPEAIATLSGLTLTIDILGNGHGTVTVFVRPSINGTPIDVPPTNDSWTTGVDNFPEWSQLASDPDFISAFDLIKSKIDNVIKLVDPRYTNAVIS